ncbi:glycosyltransferase family 10 [Pedobacter gandavensis]|uniref:glycosyltransferase family 10 domain-containing protein n=1 Tax=Pedobacter gandavensis TaxID=2679963 RepID=UPI00247A0BDD|nr:glycosyltransferase family 10 [Pedobacter gandavensis]WGQ08889.1 glycosyltransferase family 10 [Pedobacter gandavensis]
MIVKFFANYDRSEDLLKRFKANYEIYDNELSFTIGDEYDYAVVFNSTKEGINIKAKIITVIQEPSWSPAHSNTAFLTDSDYLIVHDQQLFEDTHHIKLGKKVIEQPSYMFFHDHVDKSLFTEKKSIQKPKKLSMIVSSLSFNIGNYTKRMKLLRSILSSDLDIDIYGKGFNISDPRYKGFVEYKHTALLPYEYSIAIENSNEKNYITEKFVDCAICNTIPIYCGAPNIAEVYNEKYFHTLDLDSPTIIEDIKEIIKNPAPGQEMDNNKDRYFQQRNLYRLLKELINTDV